MKNLASILFFAFLTTLFVACGGSSNEESSSSSSSSSPESQTESETTTKNNDDIPKEVEIFLLSNDQMQFNKAELNAYEGQKITLTLKHTGSMKKDIMGHNFVLLKEGVDLIDFANKAIAARDTDFIPESEADNIIAYTGLIGGGESTTVEFEAPAPGTYQYLCTFPGHYGVMQGKLVVE